MVPDQVSDFFRLIIGYIVIAAGNARDRNVAAAVVPESFADRRSYLIKKRLFPCGPHQRYAHRLPVHRIEVPVGRKGAVKLKTRVQVFRRSNGDRKNKLLP